MPNITKARANNLGYQSPNIQTILFNKQFKKEDIVKWLKDHSYKSRIRLDNNYYRALQHFPVKHADFYSKKIKNGNIILVFQKY